jgi:hypothetical protein
MHGLPASGPLTCWLLVEPPVGIEPTTCSLRETRPPAPDALAAPIARPNAQTAPDAPVEHSTRSTTRSTIGQPGRPELFTVGSVSVGSQSRRQGILTPAWHGRRRVKIGVPLTVCARIGQDVFTPQDVIDSTGAPRH